jgi:asparagine synthase (glutamine-hydrolysing)
VCGIAGIYRRGPDEPGPAARAADRALVQRMLRSIEYRGPDDEGIESAGRATLGVRRLAILDVPGGHQPLSDSSGRVWAMQNGELYDFPGLRRDLASRHALRTHTDTELLPYLWLEQGADFVRLLRGMFALAIYDVPAGTLLLARDSLGVKPLYVAEVGERVLFASELKALLCDPDLPRELDLEALGGYLTYGWIPGEATPFRTIRRLRPGCRVLLRPGDVAVRQERYRPWPPFFKRADAANLPVERLADEAGRLLGEAATAMLLSDRPVGVLLSGGLDSSVLVAMLPEEARRQTRTFSIGFSNGGHHDERRFASRVAQHLGTQHRELAVPLDVATVLPELVQRLDQPLADPAAVPAYLVARAAAAEVTVLLSGTGGDEVFGGYRRHRLPSLLKSLRFLPPGVAAAAARTLGRHSPERSSAAGERLVHVRKLLEARARGGFMDAYLSTFEPAPPSIWAEAVAAAVSTAGSSTLIERSLVAELGAMPADLAEQLFSVDFLHYLPDDLLLKEDRTTMAASVEGRVPYLDQPLVEFGAALPLETRFEGSRGKHLLRVLGRRHLPAEITERGKHGFSTPVEQWLRGPLDGLVADVFAGAGSGVFRMDVLRRWHAEHRAGWDRSGELWAALSFELWWRTVGAASPEELAAAGRPRGVGA